MKTITRTFSIRVKGHASEILQTLGAFSSACNIASKYAFDNKVFAAVPLQYSLYHTLRDKFKLKAQMTCSVFRTVAAAYYGSDLATKNKRRKQLSVFKANAMLLQETRDWSFTRGKLSINTLSGRIKITPEIGFHQSQYMDGTWKYGAATLVNRRGKIFLNISCSKEVPDSLPADNIVGVDIGLNYIAVASNIENKTIFVGGGKVKDRNNHYRRVRTSLQKKGTRGAKRVLRKLSGKQKRFQRDVNHCVSKKLVQFSVDSGRSLIALEDLKNIRTRTKHRKKQRAEFHGWSFYQLRNFIQYKAEARSLEVVLVDPRNTSKGCSRCGNVEDGQRKRHSFKCKSCGFELHSDLNASRNIALKARLQRQDFCSPGFPSITPEVASVDGEARKGIETEGSYKPSTFVVGN